MAQGGERPRRRPIFRSRAPRLLGKVSVAASLLSAALSLSLQAAPTPTQAVAAILFCFGQLLALAAGAAAWRDPWGRFGAACAGLLLTAYLLAPILWPPQP